jgi:hypothetical protein
VIADVAVLVGEAFEQVKVSMRLSGRSDVEATMPFWCRNVMLFRPS